MQFRSVHSTTSPDYRPKLTFRNYTPTIYTLYRYRNRYVHIRKIGTHSNAEQREKVVRHTRNGVRIRSGIY